MPNVYQSSGEVVYGKLRSDCNRRLLWIFYEIANHAKRKSPRLLEFYKRLLAKCKTVKQANVAVAGKIVVAVWYILMRRVPWNEAVKRHVRMHKKRVGSVVSVKEALRILREASYAVVKS